MRFVSCGFLKDTVTSNAQFGTVLVTTSTNIFIQIILFKNTQV